MKKLFILSFILYFFALKCFTQDSKYYLPLNFKKAYDAHTRSNDGNPGINYWQNLADYLISVKLEPAEKKVSGNETILYQNNSPNQLNYLVFHLLPDLYKRGQARDFDIHPEDDFEGVMISEMKVNGVRVVKNNQGRLFTRKSTGFQIILPEPLKPGENLEIDISWSYILNEHSHYREGVVNEGAFFAAYFFPRIAVIDDIDGWNRWNYSGTAEFYNDFGNFDVTVEVPADYFVWATGEWQNPEEILKDKFLQKYNQAYGSDEVIRIVTEKDLPYKNVLKPVDYRSWKYQAQNVTDFAFGVSDHYLWDATSLVVDSVTGKRVLVDAAYHPASGDFYRVAAIARESIKLMSDYFPAIPFPYPKMTVFNGLSEMEYPMMVNDISLPNLSETIKLTAHEIFHTYFPFYTGLNETKYAWMDEGITSYGESLIAKAMDSAGYRGFYFMDAYSEFIGHDSDMPLFVCSKYLRKPVYYYNSYPKAAAFFSTLHGYLGDKNFLGALQEFVRRWKGKHPTPYDFIFTFENYTGQDLSWLIRPWIFEYGYVDLALTRILETENNQVVMIEKAGHYPAPFEAIVIYEDGSEEAFSNHAGVWREANRFYQLRVPLQKKIISVELKNVTGLDADLSNNVFKTNQ